eukprot:403355445
MVVEISRHGARSPVDQKYNVTQTYWPMGEGMLTEVGQRQHYLIGTEYRRRYIEQQKLLDEKYNSQQVLVYSTFRERCYESAQAQLLGLYPPNQNAQKLSQEQSNKAVIVFDDFDSDFDYLQRNVIPQELKNNAIDSKYQSIPIFQLEEKNDFLMRAFSEKTCSRMGELYADYWDTEQIKKMEEFYYDALFVPLQKKLNMTIPKTWKHQNHIVDEISQAMFHSMPMPFELSSEEQRLIHKFQRDDFYRRRYGSRDIALYASSDLRKFIAQQMNDRVLGLSDLRFLFLSSHDSVVSMVLSALNLPQDEAPPLASTLLFEVYSLDNSQNTSTAVNGHTNLEHSSDQKHIVKLIYNDKQLDLSEYCYGESHPYTLDSDFECEFHVFIDKFVQNTVESLKDECQKSQKSLTSDILDFFGVKGETQSDQISTILIIALTVLVMLLTMVVCCKKFLFKRVISKKQTSSKFPGGFQLVEQSRGKQNYDAFN